MPGRQARDEMLSHTHPGIRYNRKVMAKPLSDLYRQESLGIEKSATILFEFAYPGMEGVWLRASFKLRGGLGCTSRK